MTNTFPAAKVRNIVVQILGSELLIRDFDAGKIYQLNEIAAAVYQACDGQTDVSIFAAKHRLRKETVLAALDELQKLNLARARDHGNPSDYQLGRRAALKLFGLAGIAGIIGNALTGCGGNTDVTMPIQGGSIINPPTTTGGTMAAGASGYVLITYVDSRGNANNANNTTACQVLAATGCASGKATLVCTGAQNNSCACTCL